MSRHPLHSSNNRHEVEHTVSAILPMYVAFPYNAQVCITQYFSGGSVCSTMTVEDARRLAADLLASATKVEALASDIAQPRLPLEAVR